MKITVWWDFENCNIPVGVNPHRVGNRIITAIRSSGIKGPVTINAFGDVSQLPRATQEALTSTGISLTHVPHSGKNSADRSIMSDIVCWVSQNPPPAHFFLISSDSDFANILHRLRMINYNIFISCTGTASRVLYSAATVMWPWNGLVKGENVPVRYFNNPPDGLYGSWYGHYKRVPDDPFEDTDNPPTSEPEDSVEPISEPKIRRVPKAVVNGILQVLHSYPEGISLSVLRTELKRNNITIDKDFYGHKSFSQFLGSLNLLKVLSPPVVGQQLPVGGGQPPVGCRQSGTLKKGAEHPDVSPNLRKDVYTNGSLLKGGDSIMDKNSILTEQIPNCTGRNLDANSSSASSFKDDRPMVDLEARKSPSVSPPTIVDSCDDSQKRDNVIAKGGLIFLLWNSLTGHRVDSILKKDDNVFELRRHELSSKMVPNLHSSDISKDVKPKDEDVDMNNLVSQKDNYEINSVHADKAITKALNPGESEKPNFVCEQKVTLFGRIVKFCKSIIYGTSDHADHSESVDKVHKIDAACSSVNASPFSCVLPEAHELFTESSFWNDLESYLLEPKGGYLILKSRTREQLLQRLQNEGPSSLKKLTDSHLSRLGHILISEKKWVEECPSQEFPYKLVIPSKNGAISSESSDLNGLYSLFPVKSKPNSDKQSVQEGEDLGLISTAPCNLTELRLWFQKHFNSGGNIEPEEFQKVFKDEFNQNLCCSFYGYSNISSLIEACSCKKFGPPRRDKVLDDCRKLLKELFEKNPIGFNISIFQLEFLQKYDYILDYNSLGYPKLMKLLQIMPGIKIENNYALPSEEQVTDTSKEEDNNAKDFRAESGNVDDTEWDDLGPLLSSTNHGNGKDHKMDKEATYAPVSLLEEEYTDSEEDIPMPPKRSARDNSLLIKILDSWEDNKEGGAKRQHRDTNGPVVDCSRNSFQKKPRTLNVRAESLQRLKFRASPKCYSFTTKDADDKEYLANRILGELRKAGDLKEELSR